MSIPYINHRITHYAVLDMLTQDDCTIGDMYRGLVARTGCAPSVAEFLDLIQWMKSTGLIDEFADSDVSRDSLFDQYKSWLATATLHELQLDPIGIRYVQTSVGRNDWQGWRSSFDL